MARIFKIETTSLKTEMAYGQSLAIARKMLRESDRRPACVHVKAYARGKYQNGIYFHDRLLKRMAGRPECALLAA